MVRAFVGIPVPEDIKRYLIALQGKIKSYDAQLKLVEPENLHISLSFLGDIGDEIGRIESDIGAAVSSHIRFEVKMHGIMIIPNESFIRVIAVDVKNDDIEQLRKTVVSAVGGKSHEPHLTLARVNLVGDKPSFVKQIKSLKLENLKFVVDSVHLFESVLKPAGPIYTTLYKSHLK